MAQLRSLIPDSSTLQARRSRMSGLFLVLLSATLVAAVACGTDRGNNDAAAQQFQVDGETMTWSPPWQQGDSRTITTTTSVELSPAIQSFLDDRPMYEGEIPDVSEPQTNTVGNVTFLSDDSAELRVAVDEFVNQLEQQAFEQPGFGESDLEQATAMLGMLEQLDLGIEFDVGTDGSISGVTNLEELAQEVRELVDSFIRLAALAGEDVDIPAEDLAMIERMLTELPETEAVQTIADSAVNAATANMFLMRSGEFTVGEPLPVTGSVPTMFGLTTQGSMRYTLTEVSDDTATVEVEVTPDDVDLVAMLDAFMDELRPIVGEEAFDGIGDPSEGSEKELAQANALFDVLLSPYTVILTLDSETGWVTAADWSVDLALPEGFEELIPEEDRDFGGFEPEDFAVTVDMRATFS